MELCVKLFQMLQYVRNKSMSEDVNIEEKCWMCYDDGAVDILTKNMLLMFSF